MKIKLEQLILDEKFYPRTDCDWMQAHRYAESMRIALKDPKAKQFPPIDVVPLGDGTFRVIDGWHRVKAAKELKLVSIEAVIIKAASEGEQFLAAVRANLTHGKGLSNFERAQIAIRLRSSEFNWGLQRVAEFLGMAKKSLFVMLHKRTGSGNGFSGLGRKSLVAKNLVTGVVAREGRLPQEVADGQRAFEGHSQEALFKQVLEVMILDAVDLDQPGICLLLKDIAAWLRAHASQIKEGLPPKAA